VPPRDPEATKERILAAALHEFSAKGISGARVDAIATRAKVNKRMLYYYFGSKDALFREILRRRLAERSEPTTLTPLRTRQERLARDGEYVRLLMWEALQTQQSRPANEALRREFFRTWIETVEEEPNGGAPVFLLKILFGFAASPEAVRAQIVAYRRLLERNLAAFERQEAGLPDDEPVYSLIALRHGIARARATLAWAEEAERLLD